MLFTMIAALAMAADAPRARPVRHVAISRMQAKRRAAYRRARAADLRAARLIRRASNRIDVTDCTAAGTCVGKSRYRLQSAAEAGPTAKDAAVSETGKECAITGPVVCTHPPTQVFKTKM